MWANAPSLFVLCVPVTLLELNVYNIFAVLWKLEVSSYKAGHNISDATEKPERFHREELRRRLTMKEISINSPDQCL